MPRTVAIRFLLAAALTACASGSDRPAVIGAAYILSDLRFLEVAQGTIDSLFGAAGPRIRLEVSTASVADPDDADLTSAVNQARHIVEFPDLVGVVGHGGSRDALLAAPIYDAARVPLIVPTATSSLLREASPWVFMLAPSDSVQGEFIAAFVRTRLDAARADIVYIPDEYGIGLRDATARALRAHGVAVGHVIPVRQRWGCPPDALENAYASALAPLLDGAGPDVVVLAARPEQSGCAVQYVHPRAPNVRFVAGDGTIPDDVLVRRAGPGLDSLYIAAFWHPDHADARGRAFIARFEAIVGRVPDYRDVMVFDAFLTMAYAVHEVGADRGRVRDFLQSLGAGRPALQGVTGPITLDPAKPGALVMTRMHEGRWVLVPKQ